MNRREAIKAAMAVVALLPGMVPQFGRVLAQQLVPEPDVDIREIRQYDIARDAVAYRWDVIVDDDSNDPIQLSIGMLTAPEETADDYRSAARAVLRAEVVRRGLRWSRLVVRAPPVAFGFEECSRILTT